MVKDIKAGERIRRLRSSLGMTQEVFGRQFAVTQSRISEWEGDGPNAPSVEAWMKLADLTLPHDPTDAVFFWQQTGIASRFLVSLAEAMLRTGEPEAARILPTAEAMLKARLRDEEALRTEGKIALVPAYAEGQWKDQASLPPLNVDAAKLERVASTHYLIAHPPPGCTTNGRGFCAGDAIVFDSFGAETRKFSTFRGQVVLVNFGRPIPRKGDRSLDVGLYVGRLSALEGAMTVVALGRADTPESSWGLMQHQSPMVQIAAFSPTQDPSVGPTPSPSGEGTREYWDRVRSAKETWFAGLTMPPGWDILGRFIALFNGEAFREERQNR